ncbi:MAG: hypothetical protein FWG79_03170 [Bacteroidales bacterium]|nr:hypothetical protein [Bacteroidales bacterium]
MKHKTYDMDNSSLDVISEPAVAYATNAMDERLTEKAYWKNALTKDQLLQNIRVEMQTWNWKK